MTNSLNIQYYNYEKSILLILNVLKIYILMIKIHIYRQKTKLNDQNQQR